MFALIIHLIFLNQIIIVDFVRGGSLKIALIGYGQMGQIVHKIAEKRNHEIVTIIDPITKPQTSFESIIDADICIDFSIPKSVINNIKKVSKLNKSIVIGTTGWIQNLEEVKSIISDKNIGLIYGSNFSIGMNLFFQINEYSAKLMNKFAEYDVYGFEMHHKRKKDSPSGTAKELVNILLNNIDRKKIEQYNKIDREITPEELHFASIRAGEINGKHTISYDSIADSIELKHSAKSREGFAMGAIIAAEYQVKNKLIGYHNFKKIFREIIR